MTSEQPSVGPTTTTATATTTESGPRGPIGTRIHLASGGVEAVIGTMAATLASLRVDGVQLTEPIADAAWPAYCNGIYLAPWPNRVRDGRWMLDGAAQQLDLTEVDRGNALHGLLQFTEHEIREQTSSSVTLGALIPAQHGWPFALDSWVRYELVPGGIRATHGVRNLSTAVAPYATGVHPYLRLGEWPVRELTVTVPAASYVEVDDRLNPLGVKSVEGTPVDLRTPRRFDELDLDTAYADLEPVDGATAWIEAPDGARLTLLQDPDWRWVQVFTTSVFPAGGWTGVDPTSPSGWAGGPLGDAIAIEPMTAPPDALNSGEGLIQLQPGAEWSGSWALRYTPAP
ncbi:aldose 1-epimerase family protein [Schumannella sp. 10F1B-5-1]|uniref:aldose 1-epimerase family protein n=1 Tax=Schumannella sp. 10F1B-5-1 TaxID=2590780 RepID=UPI0011302C93|nr:aldose 1-epimerase family protein [Schumannella sp. 10F1B-5-1]TPW72801.1 aldose 1-epimerase family protein [Schumannella sp. 10F1B-5-1]